jgi:hypothetical protein
MNGEVSDDAARHAMLAAGWSADRQVDIEIDRAALRGAGIELWPDLEAFLRRCSRLALRYLRDGRRDGAWLDSAHALREGADAVWGVRYGQALGVTFAPIGCAARDYLALYAASNGDFYGGFDREHFYLGDDELGMVRALMTTAGLRVDWEAPTPGRDLAAGGLPML